MNSYFLVFHEWLDLNDSNDVVRVEAVRPETPADINTRQTGVDKPVLPVLPNRNNMYQHVRPVAARDRSAGQREQ